MDREPCKLVVAWLQEKGVQAFLSPSGLAIHKNGKPVVMFIIDLDLNLIVVSSHKKFINLSRNYDLNNPDSLPNLYDRLVSLGYHNYKPTERDYHYCYDKNFEIRLNGNAEQDECGYK